MRVFFFFFLIFLVVVFGAATTLRDFDTPLFDPTSPSPLPPITKNRVSTTAFVAHGVTARPDIHPAFYSELPTNFATGCDWLAAALHAGDLAQVSFFFFREGGRATTATASKRKKLNLNPLSLSLSLSPPPQFDAIFAHGVAAGTGWAQQNGYCA